MRPPIDQGTILITGASSGIGREIARQLAPRARALALVARRRERLEALQAELEAAHPPLRVLPLPCDLRDLAAVDAMLARASETLGPIDILVNNAGVGDGRLFDCSDWADIDRMLRVNVVALAFLTHRLLPGMVERRRGGILNVGSGAGFVPVPGAAAYAATKHFVDGFSESLAVELADAGVVVTDLAPGPVVTEFHQAAGLPPISEDPVGVLCIPVEQCAREAIRGFERGRPVVLPGLRYRMLMRLTGILPRGLIRLGGRPAARLLRKRSRPLRAAQEDGPPHRN